MSQALEVRNLRKVYKGFRLHDVSFDLPTGYIMGLIGPNGAGKTTIIKLIMNLIRRDGGTIRVLGLDNLRNEAEVKRRIGFAYEAPCFYEDATLRDHVSAIAPFYPTWDDRRFRMLAAEFQLPLSKRFKTLSLGMKSKFALALALAHDPDLLILDEPTSGLDPVFRRELLERLAGIIEDERKAVLFSTHITADLERIADFITFVWNGEIVFSSSRDDVLDNWGIVKGGSELLQGDSASLLRGVRRGSYGVEALTSDIRAARRRFGQGSIIEKATLEDIMVFVDEEGHSNAQITA
jgi:ABC-2 type transport system ATP-binding protein